MTIGTRRWPARRPPGSISANRAIQRLRALYYMRSSRSTDWSFPGYGETFRADTFFEVGTDLLDRKIKALRLTGRDEVVSSPAE